MSAPAPHAGIAHGALVRLPPPHHLEPVLLRVADALHGKPQDEEYYPGDVPHLPEVGLIGVPHSQGVQNGNGQRDGPHPQHLEDPEPQEREELVPLVVESVVLARLQDPEEQEPGEACAPQHDEDTGDDSARVGGAVSEGVKEQRGALGEFIVAVAAFFAVVLKRVVTGVVGCAWGGGG